MEWGVGGDVGVCLVLGDRAARVGSDCLGSLYFLTSKLHSNWC